MRFLVTGGAGFIGSHLCERLIQKKQTVVCLDNFNDYYNPEIKHNNIEGLKAHPDFECVEGDILDKALLAKVFSAYQFDAVVHLAARAGVRPSIEQPQLYQKVNVEGTVNLLDMATACKVPKFILASTSSVYGNNKKVPFAESDCVDFPISPYAATKKACELLAYTYHSLYAISVTCLRFFTVYGPRQRPDMAIHKFTRMINDEQEIQMFGDGSSRRDYTFVDDIIDGIEKAIDYCDGYHIYNLGESQTTKLKELIESIEKALGKKAKIKECPMQPGDVNITFADIGKAKNEIGYAPSVPVKTGIPKFVKWFQETNQA